ncbi:MAG TPA: glycosyltransferase [Thermoanaerobaculia bacterium]|nr:glycosyltransferase [Thermoanaerobaculia bacterium]
MKECIESWKKLEDKGFELLLFDDGNASQFIRAKLGPRYERAYAACYHPAMQSDYFRLCFILVEGGCYLDADDVYSGRPVDHYFSDGRLGVQPLCYDLATDHMIPPSVFTRPTAYAPSWIFYFNNNPLISVRRHPIIEKALARATEALERPAVGELPEIQSTTGPGNLTQTIVDHGTETGATEEMLLVLHDWESVASTKWPLGYRSDARNWRLSNRQAYPRMSAQTKSEWSG